ncbi:MAG: AgmX/PglI C-terminal domain-containing protein [Myxococcota bacterium]
MSPPRLLLPLFALMLLGADPRPPEGTAGMWACVDNVDNDRDLLFDCLDPGCTGDLSCGPHLTVHGLNDGETRALGHYSHVTAYVQAGSTHLPDEVIWTSDDPTVLVVTHGILQPLAKGTTRLTASAGGFTEAFVVSVADREAPSPGWGGIVGEIGGLIGTQGSPIGSGGGASAVTEARPTTSPPSAGSPILLGRLELALVHASIKARDAEIRGCYSRALTRHPTLAGTVWVKFVVAADGKVTSTVTKSTTLGDAAVEACINAEVLRCRFGEPGGEVIVSYPFAFAPPAEAYPEPPPLPPADGEYEGDDSAECLDNTDDDQDGTVDCLDAGCVGSPGCAPRLYLPELEDGAQLHAGVALRPKVEAFLGPARLATAPPLTWSSSDKAVVTVVDGTLVPLARGTAIVTASSGRMSRSGWVEVVGSAESATAGLIGIEGPTPPSGEPEMARASGETRAMEFGEPVILGALDQTSLERVLQRDATQLSLCYERALKTNPALAGTVVVKVVIAKDGTVFSRSTKHSTLGDASVESCLHERFDSMQFPEPPGGGIVIASYPLIFAPPAKNPR